VAEPWTKLGEPLEQALLTYRCCAAPNLCGARRLDSEADYDSAILVAEIDRLREICRTAVLDPKEADE
jgi:hypothetical protein